MPPVHPALVHFPIALVTFSFVADLLGHLRDSASLRAAGFWAMVGAALSSTLTVAAGYVDMNRATLGEVHDYVDFHMYVGWVMFVAVVLLTLWRWFLYAKTERRAGWSYLVPALLVLALTAFQGWFGGEMVYAKGAGIAETGKGVEPPNASHRRIDWVMNLLGVEHRHGGGQNSNRHDEH